VKEKIKFKKIAGYTLLGLGIVGLFTPFLQGILMIAAGLGLIENKKLNKIVYNFREKIYRIFRKKRDVGDDPLEELERED